MSRVVAGGPPCRVGPSASSRRRAPIAGFSLLEVVLVLAVLALVAAALMPFLNEFLESTVQDRSRNELQAIHAAIVGDQKTSLGYVGDVGDLPASLRDLVVSPGLPGWNGPYVNGAVFENDRVLDSYGRPYEYYMVTDAAGADRLAVISGGPDRTSTNTAANPNVAASFAGTLPTDAAYLSQAGNADNQSFPPLSGPNALDVNVSNRFAVTIQAFDTNPKVNALVAGCANLYDVAVSSLPRGTREVIPYSPGFMIDLPQGVYEYAITARNSSAVLWAEKFTHYGTVTTTRTVNVGGFDSSATPTFTLTVTNLTFKQLDVHEFTTRIGSRLDPGQTRTYAVHACAQVFVRDHDDDDQIDYFVMPYAAFTRVIGTSAAAVTVINSSVKDKVDVYDNGLYLGQVKKGKSTTFTGVMALDRLTFLNHKTGATVRAPYTVLPGANTVTI